MLDEPGVFAFRGVFMRVSILIAFAALTACAPAGPDNAESLFVGECDLLEMRRRAVGIVDNADPDFAAVRGQYRMNFARRPDTRELVLYHTARPGTQAAGQPGGGYVLVFEAEGCKFDRLSKNR